MEQEESLERLRTYAKAANTSTGVAEDDEELEVLATRLTKSLSSLESQVKQHENSLEKVSTNRNHTSHVEADTRIHKLKSTDNLSSTTAVVGDRRQRLTQVRAATTAYKLLTPTDPVLPQPESPLPALLALRSTLKLVDQSKRTISDHDQRITKAAMELRREERSLEEVRYLTAALEGRIGRLRTEHADQDNMTDQEISADLMSEYQKTKNRYTKGLRSLVRALNNFVNEHLAVMLAAEDLGGPVVGDDLDIDEVTLEAGFTHQGKPKKALTEGNRGNKKRKRRNELIWGEESTEDSDKHAKSEKDAAADSIRSLTECLLNAAADDTNEDSYVTIAKESAAVRFLVRAKVAQFKPTDARKIRLVNFEE